MACSLRGTSRTDFPFSVMDRSTRRKSLSRPVVGNDSSTRTRSGPGLLDCTKIPSSPARAFVTCSIWIMAKPGLMAARNRHAAKDMGVIAFMEVITSAEGWWRAVEFGLGELRGMLGGALYDLVKQAAMRFYIRL